MSDTENMTPQEAARVMRQWADALEFIAGYTEGQDESTADEGAAAHPADVYADRIEAERLRGDLSDAIAERDELQDRAESAEKASRNLESLLEVARRDRENAEEAVTSAEDRTKFWKRRAADFEGPLVDRGTQVDILVEDRDEWKSRAEKAKSRVEELTEENERLESENADCERFRVANVGGLMRDDRELKARAEKAEAHALAAEDRVMKLAKQKDAYIEQLRVTHDQRDEAIRRAESAEARVEELEQQVRWEEAMYDAADGERKTIVEAMSRFCNERDDLRAKNGRLQKDLRQAQRDVQDYMRRETLTAVQDYMRGETRTAVRRVIRPDEVKVGQKIAWTGWESGDWYIQTATTNGGAFGPGYPGTIVLLEDAPEDATEKETS